MCWWRGSSSSSSFLLPPSSSPDLICQLLIAVSLARPHLPVGLAGPHLPALDRSGPRRTSTASSRSQWASPGPNRRESERCRRRGTSTGESLRCGPRRTSTSEIRIAVGLTGPQPASTVGLAGPQPARFCAPWASPELNRTSPARNKAI